MGPTEKKQWDDFRRLSKAEKTVELARFRQVRSQLSIRVLPQVATAASLTARQSRASKLLTSKIPVPILANGRTYATDTQTANGRKRRHHLYSEEADQADYLPSDHNCSDAGAHSVLAKKHRKQTQSAQDVNHPAYPGAFDLGDHIPPPHFWDVMDPAIRRAQAEQAPLSHDQVRTSIDRAPINLKVGEAFIIICLDNGYASRGVVKAEGAEQLTPQSLELVQQEIGELMTSSHRKTVHLRDRVNVGDASENAALLRRVGLPLGRTFIVVCVHHKTCDKGPTTAESEDYWKEYTLEATYEDIGNLMKGSDSPDIPDQQGDAHTPDWEPPSAQEGDDKEDWDNGLQEASVNSWETMESASPNNSTSRAKVQVDHDANIDPALINQQPRNEDEVRSAVGDDQSSLVPPFDEDWFIVDGGIHGRIA